MSLAWRICFVVAVFCAMCTCKVFQSTSNGIRCFVTNGEGGDNRATGAIIVFGVSSFHTTVGEALCNAHAALVQYDLMSTVYSHTRNAGDGRSPSSSLPYNRMRSTAAGVVTGIPSMGRLLGPPCSSASRFAG